MGTPSKIEHYVAGEGSTKGGTDLQTPVEQLTPDLHPSLPHRTTKSHPGQGLSFPSSLGTKDRLETQTAEGHNSKSRDQERASRLTLWATTPLPPKRDP